MSMFKDYVFVEDITPSTIISQELFKVKRSYREKNGTLRLVGAYKTVDYKIVDVIKREKQNNICAIITIKNSKNLLEYTLKNLKDHKLSDYCDLLIVDDRSDSEDIKELSEINLNHYMRVEYDDVFNFSVVNDIGANFAINEGYEEIIFWNSDLWIKSREDLETFFDTHKKEQSKITGAVLVYPPKEQSFRKDLSEKIRNTVQFGGCFSQMKNGGLHPMHFGRYLDPTDSLFKYNKHDIFMTGALILIDSELFKEVRGFNPNMAVNYQDVDLCFKCVERGAKPLIISEGCKFYHDEGVTMTSLDDQKAADSVIYAKIWANDKLLKIIPIGQLS